MKKLFILLMLPLLAYCCIGNHTNSDQTTRTEGLLKQDSTSIFYVEQGSGDTTLLFIHGWCINSGYWDSQLNYFSSNYKVVAIDLPGFGKSKSARQSWSVKDYGNDVDYIINQLKLKNVIIIGHSMSGDVMLEAALKNNPAIVGLVGIDNFSMVGVKYTPEQMAQMNEFFKMLISNFKSFAPVYAEKMLFLMDSDSACVARVKSDFVNADSVIAIATMNELVKYDSSEEARLEQLNHKLYIMNSVDLFPSNKEGLAIHCKKSFDITEIKGTGHYPMIEKPDEFNRLLEQIISKIKLER